MKWIEKNWSAMMVLAWLAMTVSFIGTVYPPGGFSKQRNPEHRPGPPKLASSWPRAYLWLAILCATAFVTSTTTMVLLLMSQISFIMRKAFERSRIVLMVMLALAISLFSQVYGFYLQMLAFPHYRTAFYILVSVVQIWSYLLLFLLPGYLTCLVVKFMWRKIMEWGPAAKMTGC